MNRIRDDQNSDWHLQRLAAQRSLYGSVKKRFAVHALLSTVVSAAIALWALFCPALRPYAVLWGFAVTVLDLAWLTPSQKRRREQAALIQESFDCELFGLPWQPMKVGRRVDAELVAEEAARYRKEDPKFATLRDWYPDAIKAMPLHVARIVCQRINAWWDAKQRRRYGLLLASGVGVLLVGLVIVGVARSMTVPDLLMTTLAPLAPGIVLAAKQYRDNSAAATRLERLKVHATAIWDSALQGASEETLTTDSRALQDELFDNRKHNVPVFDWLYQRLRNDQEDQMRTSAAEMVRKFEAARRDSIDIDSVRGRDLT